MSRVLVRVRALVVGGCGLLAWMGCSGTSTEGVTVDVAVEAPSSPPVTRGARTFDTDGGVHVVLTRGYLNTGSLEIFACDGTPTSSSFSVFALRRAYAHSVGSPTSLGVPLVQSLLEAAGATRAEGTLHPPPASYCRVKRTIAAADPDALGTPADGSMTGKSLLVEGTYAVSGGAPTPFSFASTASFDLETIVDATTLSTEGRRTATVVLSWNGDRWFDGVDFAGDPHDATTRILGNVRAALGARIE